MLLFTQNLDNGYHILDSGSSSDSVSIVVTFSVPDALVGNDSASQPITYLSIADIAAGIDTSAITVQFSLADISGSIDTYSLQVSTSVSDTALSADTAHPGQSKNVSDTSYSIEDIRIVNSAFNYITVEGNKLNPDTYLEFFDFDATLLFDRNGTAGTISYYTNTPTGGGTAPILWRGNNYYPLPFELTGVENRGDGTAPARPHIAISNVNQFLMAAILSLGDLVGMKVTRWRTFYKFTDNGSQPNTLMTYPIDTWTVTKKIAHTKMGIQFEMSSPLDRPGLKLPREQILRDKGFPGVSNVRMR